MSAGCSCALDCLLFPEETAKKTAAAQKKTTAAEEAKLDSRGFLTGQSDL